MLTSRRFKSTSLIHRLVDDPDAFSFYQAIKLLEHYVFENEKRSASEKVQGSLGVFANPNTEVISFDTRPALKFPDRYLTSISGLNDIVPSDQRSALTVGTNVISLAGSTGVLPYHYTELILQRIKQKDSTLSIFLDIFNHRTLSLLYRSHWKYRFTYAEPLENTVAQREQFPTTPKSVVKSLVGIGTPSLSKQLAVPDETLLYFAGLLSHSVRSTHGLRQLLTSFFKLPVKIEEFIGKWQNLEEEFCSQLASRQHPKGLNAQLGCSAMLGKRIWVSQAKVRIVLGPLSADQYACFSPGSPAIKILNELAKFYLGLEHEYDISIDVDRRQLPTRTQLTTKKPSIMGWNSWLSSEKDNSSAKPLRITLSSR